MNIKIKKLSALIILFLLIPLSAILISQDNHDKWKIVIAGEDEPGERILVTGKVYHSDGIIPAVGITIYTYHTNSAGYYGKGDELLNGTMITNSEGKYQFSTIKPGSYPEGRNPAHVHIKITGKNIEEQWLELRFEGDPYISESELKKETAKGRYSQIQKLVFNDDRILSCTMDIKLAKDS